MKYTYTKAQKLTTCLFKFMVKKNIKIIWILHIVQTIHYLFRQGYNAFKNVR